MDCFKPINITVIREIAKQVDIRASTLSFIMFHHYISCVVHMSVSVNILEFEFELNSVR